MKNIASIARYTLLNAHRRFIQGIGLVASLELCIFGLLTAHKRGTQVGGWRYINAIVFAAGLLPTAYAQTPVTNAAKVAVGASGTCLLANVGGVKCWGDGAAGALGNNTDITVKTPVDVLGLTLGVRDIAAGSLFACAVTNAGGVKCWGSAVSADWVTAHQLLV